MSLTPSTMLSLGTTPPEFHLRDVTSQRSWRLSDFDKHKGLLVMFICQHCPYVQHIKGELGQLWQSYKTADVGIVAISANDVASYPDDAPEALAKFAKEEGYGFPFLYDESQSVAKAYTAACTPDFFLFSQKKLVYRGQLDDSRPGNGKPVTGKDLRAAIEAVLNGRPVASDQKPSIGCNIKWKPGNEPNYFRLK